MQLVSLSHTLCDEGRAAEAEDLCRWVLSQAPNLPSAQVAFGRARLEQGHLQESRAILEAAALKHPAFFAAQRWLAEVLVRLGDWPRASEVLVKAEALSPGQPRIGELVRQVMGMGPVAPPPKSYDPGPTPPPPVRTPGASGQHSGTAGGVRRRTYMGPAVADPVPATATLALPAAPPPIKPANSLGSSQQNARARAPAAHGNTPTRRQPYPSPPPLAGGALADGIGRRWYAWRQLAGVWMRLHPRAALMSAGVVLFTAAALTVVLVSWALRPRGDGSILGEWVRPGAEGAPLPPVRAAAFDELSALLRDDRRLRLPGPGQVVGRPFLALGLMASEYGRPVDRETEQVADEMSGRLTGKQACQELDAGRVLFRLSRGERDEAQKIAARVGLGRGESPLLAFVEARRLARSGDPAGALAALGKQPERASFLPARLLTSELLLDRGQPAAALPIIHGVLAESPGHALAVQQLIEASHGISQPPAAADARVIEAACNKDRARIPSLAAACLLHEGMEARRQGRRKDAQLAGLDAAEVAPGEPRLLANTALLLVNTGSIVEAQKLVRRASLLADPRLPPLAWARAGVALATDRTAKLPAGTPPGPEARLVAVRASFVGPRVEPPAGALALTTDGEEDRDLRWVSDGARVKGAEAARAMATRVRARYGAQPPGPVAAFVAGTLARRGGEHPLARTWLSRSLDGHGDACRAASLYRISLKDQGRNPRLNARLQRAIGRLGCERLK